MSLTLNGAVAVSSGVEALSYGVPVQDSQTFLHLDAAGLPLSTVLSTDRELEVAASYGGGFMGPEPVDPGGEGFAFTEVSNEYTLTVVGQGSSGCGLSKPTVTVTLASPDYVQATAFGKGRGGSIKIEKW
jgi:hypothetical protein